MRFSHRESVDSLSGCGLEDHGGVAVGSLNGFETVEVARDGSSLV
jgi:hypothetical protein